MFCRECGKEINDNNVKNCPVCGVDLNSNIGGKTKKVDIPNISTKAMTIGVRGRISGTTYWKYYAILLPIYILFTLFGELIPDVDTLNYGEEVDMMGLGYSLLILVSAIPLIFIAVSANVRRFHDFNISGWFVLPLEIVLAGLDFVITDLAMYPAISILIDVISISVISLIPSYNGENKYGTKPDVL